MVDKEAKKREKLTRPSKYEIINQIDYYLRDASVNAYLIQRSLSELKKLIIKLIQKGMGLDVSDFKIAKKKDGSRALILYCPFGIRVRVREFIVNKIIEKWGEKSE
jgi:hypothetical protein